MTSLIGTFVFATFIVHSIFALDCSKIPCGFCPNQKCPESCGTDCQQSAATPSGSNTVAATEAPAQTPAPAPASESGPAPTPAPASPGGPVTNTEYEPYNGPPITDEEADARFMACCQRVLPENQPCWQLCSYKVNLLSVRDRFTDTDEHKADCPFAAINKWMYCASDGASNVPCCKKSNYFREDVDFETKKVKYTADQVENACTKYCLKDPAMKTIGLQDITCITRIQIPLTCFRETLLP